MDVLFAEGWDKEVQVAVVELSRTRPGHKFRVLLKKEHAANNSAVIRKLKQFDVICDECESEGFNAPYVDAISQLASGRVDILLAGADIPHFTFLPLLFRGLKVHRKSDLLTSFALIEGQIERADRRILMLDPTVVTDPTVNELCQMTTKVADVATTLLGKKPTIAVISHATGRDRPDRDTKQSKVIKRLQRNPVYEVLPEPVQIDTALFRSAADKKNRWISTMPNLLVLPDITSANILYKCCERIGFQYDRLTITSPLLCRSPVGEAGLLPRTTYPSQIVRSFDVLVRMARIPRISE